MGNELAKTSRRAVTSTVAGPILPAVIANAGEKASKRFIEFLTATIRNANTRQAYARAIGDFFAWSERHRLALGDIEPVHVAAYIEQLTKTRSAPTVKQHLAAIRMCGD
jgi:site-specific recombinase XerD